MARIRLFFLTGTAARWRSAVVLLLCLTLLISACSFRFIYRQLDWLVPWRLNDYVTFNLDQQSELEKRLLEQLTWHCGTQLKEYAAWFRELQQTPQPFSREDIERFYWRTNEFWLALMEQLSPDLAALLSTASEEQIEELFTNLERRNRELDEKYVSTDWDTVQERRIERMTKIIERWLGRLDTSQRKVIAVWARELGQSGDEWIASRRRWQSSLQEALSLRDQPNRFEERIERLLVDPQMLWPEAYRREYERMRVLTLDMLAEVAALQTPRQEQHLLRKLGDFADDFVQLACSESVAGEKSD